MALMRGLSKLVVLGRGKGMGEREERTISKREGREMKSNLSSYGEISVPGTQLLSPHASPRSLLHSPHRLEKSIEHAGQQDKQHSSELYILRNRHESLSSPTQP